MTTPVRQKVWRTSTWQLKLYCCSSTQLEDSVEPDFRRFSVVSVKVRLLFCDILKLFQKQIKEFGRYAYPECSQKLVGPKSIIFCHYLLNKTDVYYAKCVQRSYIFYCVFCRPYYLPEILFFFNITVIVQMITVPALHYCDWEILETSLRCSLGKGGPARMMSFS